MAGNALFRHRVRGVNGTPRCARQVPEIMTISKTGKLPCLLAKGPDGTLVAWESLGILKNLVELFFDFQL